MSFAGDLEHLPLVDVIQLLHSTRKTGTLCLKSHKGESKLVFNDGYIVSSNHMNNCVRIGQILIDMGTITKEKLEQAITEQKSAGIDRKPLIAILIEGGYLNKDDAYAGLENLIEMTIVEVLTWTKGTFTLDVHTTVISDEYRYFPETLKQDILLNTQSVLMDALRIYDEKIRDGTLDNGAFSTEETRTDADFGQNGKSIDITIDVLGLGDLDKLDKKIPDVFLGLKDYDPAEIHRQKIREELADVKPDRQERFLSFLMEFSGVSKTFQQRITPGEPALAVIVFSRDELIKHSIMTVCKHENLFVFTTDEEENLDHIVNQALSKELLPFLVIDSPETTVDGLSPEKIISIVQQKGTQYPEIIMLQLVSPDDYVFSMQALEAGVRSVFPKPVKNEQTNDFVDDLIKFLKAFQAYIKKSYFNPARLLLREFKESISKFDGLLEAPDVAFIALSFVSAMFERSITFVVGTSELIAEKGIGAKTDKSVGATRPMMFKIPLSRPSVFQDVIESGLLFYGQSNDTILKKHLFNEIGVPYSSKILLVPIKSFGRVIALIYGDFGSKPGAMVNIELINIVARFAGLVLDNTLYRRKLLKSA